MQTWKTRDVPDEWLPSVLETKRLMPDWEYTLMTDDDNLQLVKDRYPWFLKTYTSFKYPIMRADVIRYMWLHANGGVYYDLDLCPVLSLEQMYDMLKDVDDCGLYLVKSGNGGHCLTNSFMASSANHPFWLYLLKMIAKTVKYDDYPFYARYDKHLYVLHTTGPQMLDRAAREWKGSYNILPSSRVNAYSMCDVEYAHLIEHRTPGYYKPHSMMRPLPGSSWVSPGMHGIVCTVYCKPYVPVLVMLVVLLLFTVLIKRLYI